MRQLHIEEDHSVEIKLPWDSNTAKGFGVALVVTGLALFISSYIDISVKSAIRETPTSIPIELLSFGRGDGTGQSKGNLTAEGAKQLSKKNNPNPLQDAARTPATLKEVTKNKPSDYVPGDRPRASQTVAEQTSTSIASASGTQEVGAGKSGSASGTGLGEWGSGRGAGEGYGDISWGGGGNRSVLSKPLPEYPKGVTTAASIRLRFTVRPNGTVETVMPLVKGDPLLEQAAMRALRRWRFNPIDRDVVMTGEITFHFRIE